MITRLTLPLPAALGALMMATGAAAGELPDGFVYLREVDSTIRQDIRYAGTNNFTRALVPGYFTAECILARPVAEALAMVQKQFARVDRTLIVFDCYRPARAVDHFMTWTRLDPSGIDPDYHPKIRRGELVSQGYIAARSGHSSGGSVDLTFGYVSNTGEVTPARMGRFDLFGEQSNTLSRSVPAETRRNRAALVDAMRANGFVNYAREWWHFRFKAEPYAGQVFDFPILRQPN